MTSTQQVPTTRRSMTAAGAALVVLAVGQVVSGGLVSVFAQSPLMQPDRVGEPPITPGGYAFSIWGLIEAVCLGLAIWMVWFRRRADEGAVRVVDALTRPLLVVFAGFTVWLVASVVEPVWATLAVFLVMGLGLAAALRVAVTARAEVATWSPLGRGLLWWTLGLYAGWSTVAIWLNLTTALAFSGAPVTGTLGVAGQLAVLAGATATAVLVLRWTGGLLPYAAAVVWALVGAVLGGLRRRSAAACRGRRGRDPRRRGHGRRAAGPPGAATVAGLNVAATLHRTGTAATLREGCGPFSVRVATMGSPCRTTSGRCGATRHRACCSPSCSPTGADSNVPCRNEPACTPAGGSGCCC